MEIIKFLFLTAIMTFSFCLVVSAADAGNWHDDACFGIHFDLHASMSDTNLGEGLTEEALEDFLKRVKPDWIQCDCKGHAGITSWPTKVGTPSPGIKKDALRIHRDVTQRMGVKLGVHYSGVYDMRACELHPDWEAKNADGSGSKGMVCLTSDYAKELEIPQMEEIVREYDVDGFWVDGDCWAVRCCWCDRCKAEFKKRTGLDAPKEIGAENWLAYNKFFRDLFDENVTAYTNAIHAIKPECTVISNWFYTFGHPSPEKVPTDYISGDLSPNQALKSAMLEGAFLPNRTKDWDLMVWGFTPKSNGPYTGKSALRLTQECAYISACGGSSMIYEQPQRNGVFTDWYTEEFAKVSEFIKKRGMELRHTKHYKQALILMDEDWFYRRYGTFLISLNAYPNVTGAAQVLNELHIPVSIAETYMVQNDLSDYSLIVVPEIELPEAFMKRLAAYAENGGNIIFTGSDTGYASELLGISDAESQPSGAFWIEAGNRVASFSHPWQKVKADTAEVFRYKLWQQQPDINKGSEPMITINKVGKGTVAGIYTNYFAIYDTTAEPSMRTIIGQLIDAMDISFDIYDVSAPYYMHLIAREKDGTKYISFVNTGSTKSLLFGDVDTEEIPYVKEVSFRMKLDQKPGEVSLLTSRKKNLSYTYKDKVLTVKIKDPDIEDTVVIK